MFYHRLKNATKYVDGIANNGVSDQTAPDPVLNCFARPICTKFRKIMVYFEIT